jgi:ribosomal protein S18 acetylase RimI-like enzyme
MTFDLSLFHVREEVRASDRSRIFNLLHSSGYFLPREMSYGMDLLDEHLMKGEKSSYHFVLYERDDALVGYGCYGPIRLCDRRYHLLWVLVDPAYHHQGLGRHLEAEIIKRIRSFGGVKVYAQTSNRDYHKAARAFYEGCGYQASATIPDYYGDKDDVVFYVKDVVKGK